MVPKVGRLSERKEKVNTVYQCLCLFFGFISAAVLYIFSFQIKNKNFDLQTTKAFTNLVSFFGITTLVRNCFSLTFACFAPVDPPECTSSLELTHDQLSSNDGSYSVEAVFHSMAPQGYLDVQHLPDLFRYYRQN